MPWRTVPVAGRSHSPATPATLPASMRTPRGLSVSIDIQRIQRRCAGIDTWGENAGLSSACRLSRSTAAIMASDMPCGG